MKTLGYFAIKAVGYFTILWASILLLTSCNPSDVNSFVDGNYDGILILRDFGAQTQNFITASLKRRTDREFELTATREDGGSSANLKFLFTLGTHDLRVIGEDHEPWTLRPAGNNCFQAHNESGRARLCFDQREVTFDTMEDIGGNIGENMAENIRESIGKNTGENTDGNTSKDFGGPPGKGSAKGSHGSRGLTLIIDLRTKGATPPEEPPAQYTKNALLSRAINQSFATRIGFEKVVQAKLNGKLNTLNLLPQFSLNTYVGFSAPSFVNFLKVIGDLAPFLLPSRWSKSRSARSLYDAELYSWITMKADAGNIVEGLAYSILEQKEIISTLEENRMEVTTVRDQIRERETTGLAQIGASDDITAVIESIDEALVDWKRILQNSYSALSHAAGFMSPSAVSEVLATKFPFDVENPTPVDPKTTSRLALERAFELRQLESLIDAARSEKKGRFFNWLDPNGDSAGHLGFGFPSYIEIASSRIRELENQKEDVQSSILEKVNESLTSLDIAVKQSQIADHAKSINERRIARVTNNMALGINYALADLVSAFQDRVKDGLLFISAKYSYLLAWSRLNRLLYTGPYSDLGRGKLLSPDFDAELSKDSVP